MTQITHDDLEAHIRAIVKSNIITLGLTIDQIEKTALEVSKDVLDAFDNYITNLK